jgi:hypothetical protein
VRTRIPAAKLAFLIWRKKFLDLVAGVLLDNGLYGAVLLVPTVFDGWAGLANTAVLAV